MSEVINRIHDLQKQVFQLEEELRKIRSKYGDEVDHSDDLANLVRDMAKSLNGLIFFHLNQSWRSTNVAVFKMTLTKMDYP